MDNFLLKSFLVVFVCLVFMVGCKDSDGESDSSGSSVTTGGKIIGAGASFPEPLYSKMFKKYFKMNKTEVDYAKTGSGTGIKRLLELKVQFAASDAPMKQEELKKTEALNGVFHIPGTIGAIAIIYNHSEVKELNLTGEQIVKIFMGEVKDWKELVPELKESKAITRCVRADKSGTSFAFSEYLAKISDNFKQNVGVDKMPKWPEGKSLTKIVKGQTNDGVSSDVKGTSGAIGYVELAYAFNKEHQYAAVKNLAGEFVKPSAASASLCGANDAVEHEKVFTISNPTADLKGAYPISTFTWLLMYKEQKYEGNTLEKAKMTVELLKWMISKETQKMCEENHYAPIPEKARKIGMNFLNSITFDGKPLFDSKTEDKK